MTATIVVGYDGSDHADDALALGRLLAGIAHARLIVACAYPHDPLGESATGLEVASELRADAERTLEQARTRLTAAGVDADVRAVAGPSPSHVLHALAEESGAEAIVVGATHHGKGLRLLTGSTPQAVLDHAPCAVAVAPDGFRDAPAAAATPATPRLAVAYDGSPEAQHTVAVAAAWARRAGARLRLVTAVNSAAVGVYPPPPLDVTAYEELAQLAREDAQLRLDEAIAALGPEVDAEGAVLDGDPVATLVEESGADDLLFTGSRGQGPFRRVLLGSVSTHLLRDAACPVIVVPRGSGEPAPSDGGDVA
jgi:nucleotide-binding universal stress UspA family protein